MAETSKATKERFYWIDAAKAIGMFLVYFGHVVQEMSNKGIQYSYLITKFIYSFHMPLFFLIAGFFFRRTYSKPTTEAITLFLKRILPVFFFGLLSLPLWPIYMYGVYGLVKWNEVAVKIRGYIFGHPDLNTITWFLVCLFMVEIISKPILRHMENATQRLLISGIFFYFGLMMTANFQATVTSLGISKNLWYIHEALVGFGFYALGYCLFKYIKKISSWHPIYRFVFLVFASAAVFLTFNLNKPYDGFVVIMKNSSHGSSLYFLLTAIMGSFAIMLLAMYLPKIRLLDYIGRNSLSFIATSGFFHHFVNPIFVKRIGNSNSGITVILYGFVFALISLAISVPVVWLVNHYFPQLTGKPFREGPILPSLNRILPNRLRQ